jgi:neurotransmitter:Na+ symporter, NSS family
VLVTSTVMFLAAHVPILGLASGTLDEIDFWAGTFGVTLLVFVETIMFVWLFRLERAWEEIYRGTQVRIPRFFLWVLTYVKPL